mmetsp:Transcript_10346/g.22776  ORF Transcript_10346/g.22776 Transcript_10346/m.22776 type:complete len:1195 (-) Transcript_10346:89-3673(-)|eukprot:CAMPEP_0168751974 /NCGR_PEP_ID=MMETSP0724-20121128/18134_1 /TAXON_ID=265536 /ORGANISM="Amphiprora sp., Strain CCMP467" /LENGTH=1194 /DNA_ID=CAMNT_0008800183 /DNA_START=68 /DNA_END=3652 /DNA_ORIENTATION=-
MPNSGGSQHSLLGAGSSHGLGGGSNHGLGRGSNHGKSKKAASDSGAKAAATAGNVEKIAAQESKYLTISRIVVIVIILAIAAIVSTGAYLFLDNTEEDNYNDQYEYVTNTAKDAVAFHVNNVYLSVNSLSRILSAEAKSSAQTFPFVTFPIFETLCLNARVQGGFKTITYQPLVNLTNLQQWNNYSHHNQNWMVQSRESAIASSKGAIIPSRYIEQPIPASVYFGFDEGATLAPEYGGDTFMPIWMTSPPPYIPVLINFDLYALLKITIDASISAREPVMAEVQDASAMAGTLLSAEDNDRYHTDVLANNGSQFNPFDHPHTQIFAPVFEDPNDDNSAVVGVIDFVVTWDKYMAGLLPEGTFGVHCVVKNTCGQSYTYKIEGNKAIFLGKGDLHETKFDSTEVVLPFYDLRRPNETTGIWGHCLYSYHMYASQEYEDKYRDKSALGLTMVVASTFFFIIMVFFLYDWFLKRRNSKVLDVAAKTSAIVASLFPTNVRDRLLNAAANDAKTTPTLSDAKSDDTRNRMKLKNFLQSEVEIDSTTNVDDQSNDHAELHVYGSKPIADIFPDTTIMFADIVGFTAWSSTREPSQVFTLLENIYKSFDDIATRRRVFKVETVGDCYVAVCGLPDPRNDHAVVMARFARACLKRMQELVHKLEVMLGPDTADLNMRIGLHSGPVTAGVLRGERARFQLFGDTMNTASRMESNGMKGMIQMSQETADLLTAAGKGSWIFPREDKIVAKGKGSLQTYWLASERPDHGRTSSQVEEQRVATEPNQIRLDKSERLIKWNGDLLLKLLKEIEASRDASLGGLSVEESKYDGTRSGTVLDEVEEIVHLPNFALHQSPNPNTIQLSPEVEDQLLSYIGAVSMLYKDNPFHCFEHASHVTMSVSKLMSRIIAPDLSDEDVGEGNVEALLHDHTYGITSDPLTQFACVFSALIHDVDHTGVPNNQLNRENPQLAEMYGGRSTAEQNSVDLAWKLLMSPDYEALRHAIYKTPDEQARFRQLVVNSVMATDIMDKDLKQLRNARWERAFADYERREESQKDVVDRKATIVIEHLIQASDVSHTMQHWHIYRKWNQRLFTEMYDAYMKGRADKNPADFWYKGEIGFFDFYIIPLAKKLKDCGVFGVSSDEYLNYATKNREEWEQRGQEVIAEMMNELKQKYPTPEQEAEVASGSSSGVEFESEEPTVSKGVSA